MGSDKKLLLKNLPDKLPDVIPAGPRETVVKLWQEFGKLYKLMVVNNPTEEQVTEYFTKAVKLVEMFVSLNGPNGRLGYEKARVTPYMHALVYHVPRFMITHQDIKKFTGQGVEKLNDDCRRIHLNRSNKWDSPKDILTGVEYLSKCERERRRYQRQNSDYWENGIKESRAKRHRTSVDEVENVDENAVNTEEFTAVEIKQKLKDLGVKTRYRSLRNLKQLLIDTLTDKENQLPNI